MSADDRWQIRRARVEDAAEIARLATLLGYPNDSASMQLRLRQLATSADDWVAVVADVPISSEAGLGGWMHVALRCTLESGEFAELLGLVVDPNVRRGGVGRRLVAEAERWACSQRLGRLTVRSNVARGESHTFYPALGFVRAKSQHVYSKVLGEDAQGVA